MNVDQPSVKSLNELALDDHHEASKGNEVGDGVLDGAKERPLKSLRRGMIVARDNGGWDVGLLGYRKRLRIGSIADNVVNLEAILMLNQGLKVRASAGQENGNFSFAFHFRCILVYEAIDWPYRLNVRAGDKNRPGGGTQYTGTLGAR